MSQYDKYGRYFISWFKFNSFWLAVEMLDIFLLVFVIEIRLCAVKARRQLEAAQLQNLIKLIQQMTKG